MKKYCFFFIKKIIFFHKTKNIVFSFENIQESSEMMRFWIKDQNFTITYHLSYIYHGKYDFLHKINISAHEVRTAILQISLFLTIYLKFYISILRKDMCFNRIPCTRWDYSLYTLRLFPVHAGVHMTRGMPCLIHNHILDQLRSSKYYFH